MKNTGFSVIGIILILSVSGLAADLSSPRTMSAKSIVYGSFVHPFAVNSPWNIRPLGARLDSSVIPTDIYYPSIETSPGAIGVFQSRIEDGPAAVIGNSSSGVSDPDCGCSRTINISHWPHDLIPAQSSDGHAEIVDPTEGIIHSFWQLRQTNGRWTASSYGWSSLNGRGWGDPAHFYQGVRAAGVPSIGGLIRKEEVNDGAPIYYHALAISLAASGLSAKPGYVIPATTADSDRSKNYGAIQEGALLMLPADYDSSRVANLELRKVIETLKTYGGYVVDRNGGTPFQISVERGADFKLMPRGWDNSVANELDKMRKSMRRVISAEEWQDQSGKRVQSPMIYGGMNLLSMRGPWKNKSGNGSGMFDSKTQFFLVPPNSSLVKEVNRNFGSPVYWPTINAGDRLSLKKNGAATISARLVLLEQGRSVFDSGWLTSDTQKPFLAPKFSVAHVFIINNTNREESVQLLIYPD